MKKYFKSIWFYLGFIAFFLLIIVSCGQYSDFDLDNDQLTLQPIAFISKQDTLSGSLILPIHKEIKAIVILIHGDGAQDRLSNSGYLPLINQLIDAGIGIYTWDKAGIGESKGNWLHQSMQDRADEAQIAFELIKNKFTGTNIKIGYLGFSQAGWVIPIAASHSNPDFSVIIGGAVNWREQGAYYEQTRLQNANASDKKINEKVTKQLQQNDLIFGVNGSHDSSTYDDMSDDRFYFVSRNYLSDSAKNLPSMNGRILAIWGEVDLNVDSNKNACLYRQLTADKSDTTIALLPSASHGLLKAPIFNYQLESQWPWWVKIFFIYQGRDSYAPNSLNIITTWITDDSKVPTRYTLFECKQTK
ncbi:alpha/beta hydrolase [Orbus sturtevantii]|uniref:alpha/beta hydrolase family protein n=1 Tax=Orbus sturtevantii TaxID=3074109 RepID=UPI00370D7D87